MPGHLWEITEFDGEKVLVVTRSNREESALQLYRKTFGHHIEVLNVKYVSFIGAIEE